MLLLLLAGIVFTAPARPALGQVNAASSPAAVTSAATPPATAVKEPVPISIFFTPEELQRMRTALIAYEKSKKAKISNAESKANDFLNQLTDSEPKAKPAQVEKVYVYPQFFLNSLVFDAEDDWVVLVNNQRFSAKVPQSDPELKVLNVDREKVSLEWTPKKMDRVMESWEKNVNEQIGVDPVVGTVTFTLRPNQTFSSYAMRVLEGKVRPVMIVIKQEVGAADDAGAPADNAAPQGEDPAEELKKIENITTEDIKNNVGVKGLNKTYKRIGLEE